MRRQFDKIEFMNGDLCLWNGGAGRTYPCPFAYPTPCGTWCLHCGDVKPVEPIVNGSVVLERADGMKYQLQLSCGSGITIEAKEFEVVSFDASKGSVGVGKPVQQYKEMPKPAGKSREIAWSKTFTFTNLIKTYNQCQRKRKKSENKQ